MPALASSELAERDRRPAIALTPGNHRPQAPRAAKCPQPIAWWGPDGQEAAQNAFRRDAIERLRRQQLRFERSRHTPGEAADTTHGPDLNTMSVAHEVNQPLAAIVTNAETCLRRLDQAEPDLELIRELARRVILDARRASDIAVRASDMARGIAPRYAPLPFNGVIEEAIGFLRPEFLAKDIGVSLDAAPVLPFVVGDRTQLQQVVVNLLVNAGQAVAAATAGGQILIRTSQPSAGIIQCSIEDDGPGIAPAYLPHLFNRLFTTKANGTGIGLQISRSIVEAHGGSIRADNHSSLGGARFTFTLPGSIGGQADAARALPY